MNRSAQTLIGGYAKLWPRELCDFKSTDRRLKTSSDRLGVYILYRDDDPFYFGKAPASVFSRIQQHANKHYRLWNYSSAFVVRNKKYIRDVEGILIAGIPKTSNRQEPRFRRIRLPKQVLTALRARREIEA
jgi:hypothetical protein